MAERNVGAIIFRAVGLLLLIVALVPILRGGSINTGLLSGAVVVLLLSLAVRPRRRPTPPGGPGA